MFGGPAWQAELFITGGEVFVGQAVGETRHRGAQVALAADQQGSFQWPITAPYPTLQGQGRRQTECADQATTSRCIGEVEVAIGHGTDSRAETQSG